MWVDALVCTYNASLCQMWRSWTLSKASSLDEQPRLVAPDWTAMAERAASSSQSSREAAGVGSFLKNSMYSELSVFPPASMETYAPFACDDTLPIIMNPEGFGLICWDILRTDSMLQTRPMSPMFTALISLPFLAAAINQNIVWWQCAFETTSFVSLPRQ